MQTVRPVPMKILLPFFNKIPNAINKKPREMNVIILAEYRNLIWNTYLQIVYHNKQYGRVLLDHIFKKIIERKVKQYSAT